MTDLLSGATHDSPSDSKFPTDIVRGRESKVVFKCWGFTGT